MQIAVPHVSDLRLSSAVLSDGKVVEVGDLKSPRLGLSPERWDFLASKAAAIVHAGAEVNSVLPFTALKAANVDATVGIDIDLTPGEHASHK